MMQINCPSCGSLLRVSEEHIGRRGRCPSCQGLFPIVPEGDAPPAQVLPEDTIMGWLMQGGPGQDEGSPDTTPPQPPGPDQPTRTQPEDPGLQAPESASANDEYRIKLDHVDSMGAFFLFDSQLLYDDQFRASFPQQCVICGQTSRLGVHLINWSSKLDDRARGSTADDQPMVCLLDSFGGIGPAELVGRLEPHKSFAPPYSLPFPYYLCQDCPSVGAVITHVRTGPDGRDRCELGICSLPQAEAFVAAVNGPDCPDCRRIRQARKKGQDAWQLLPLSVRIRIGHWYKPQADEQFLAYVPDADFSRAEAGVAGVVATDRRLIYRRGVKLVEIPLTEQITIRPQADGKLTVLEIVGESGAVASFSTHQAGAARLAQLVGESAGSAPGA